VKSIISSTEPQKTVHEDHFDFDTVITNPVVFSINLFCNIGSEISVFVTFPKVFVVNRRVNNTVIAVETVFDPGGIIEPSFSVAMLCVAITRLSVVLAVDEFIITVFDPGGNPGHFPSYTLGSISQLLFGCVQFLYYTFNLSRNNIIVQVTEALDSFFVLALDRCCEGDCGSEECVAVLIPMEIVAARHRSLFILQKSCNSGFQYDMKELRFVEGGRGSSECERAGNDTRNVRLKLRSFLAASSLLMEACLFHWAWVKFVAFFLFCHNIFLLWALSWVSLFGFEMFTSRFSFWTWPIFSQAFP
jgi:hypothetical protein